MKTLGLIGGMTWLSTLDYYRIINQLVSERLGGSHSARILMYSLDFEDIKPPPGLKDWTSRGELLAGIAKRLEQGGAECLVLCANTAHLVADVVQRNIGIPLIHVAEETALEIASHNISTVGLLGTRFTMEHPFYKDKLSAHGITAVTPGETERDFIHATIFDELGKNILKPETKARYLDIIEKLKRSGAQGIILGCTEIPLLLKQPDCALPLFDTTMIHAKAAVEFALKEQL